MNWDTFETAQKKFLDRYPLGFRDPEMLEIGKKHKLQKMINQTQEGLAVNLFDDIDLVLENMRKIVTQSSMVSVFEKPKFRDLLKDLSDGERIALAMGLKDLLHGDQEAGFNQMISVLLPYKLAKWTLLTICPVYFNSDHEVFIKPTTAKNVISFFDIQGMVYSPKASWEFYRAYRDQINLMKSRADKRLQVDSAAFSGFLMMSMDPEF